MCKSCLWIASILFQFKTCHNIFSYLWLVAKPGKPEGPLEVSDVHKDGCKLKWKKPKDDGGEPVEGYLVEKYDPYNGLWLPVGKCKDPEMDVSGLTPGHEYQFRVKAINKERESEPLETFGSIVAKDPFCKLNKLFDITESYSQRVKIGHI